MTLPLTSGAANYSPGYQNPKTPRAANPLFTPSGRVERVRRTFDGQGRLQSISEVVLGTCTVSGSTVSGTVRFMKQTLPWAPSPGSAPITTTKLAVLIEVWANGTKISNDTNGWQVVTTDSNGLATFSRNLGSLSSPHGVVRVRAWYDESHPTNPQPYSPAELDAWASVELPRGTVVSLTAFPDVADDKNLFADKRARFQLRRNPNASGTWTGLPALSVRVQLIDSGILRPTDNVNLTAKYGTSLGSSPPYNDYYLTGTGWPSGTVALNSPQAVTILAGQEFYQLTVVPWTDNLTEANVIRLQVLPDDSGNDYSVGLQATADVAIYDGPEYTLYELTGPQYDTVYDPKAVAVNAGVISSGVWTVPPQVVGSAIWPDSYDPRGILWTSFSSFSSIDFGTNFHPYGISFRASTAAGDRARLVGANGTKAWRVLDNGSGGVQLPHFPGASGPSLAWGISPDGSRAVGYSTISGLPGIRKPMVWLNTANPVNLTQYLDSSAEGEALAVNNAGVIVGFSSGFPIPSGPQLKRPFRNQGSGAQLGDGDWLAVPAGGTGKGEANAVTTSSGKHYAAGWYELDSVSTPPAVAAFWRPTGSSSLPTEVVGLGFLARNGVLDAQSEALGVNSALRIVGWSGPSPTHANRRAVFSVNGSAWVDLNDKHFTHGLTGWTLQQANAISDTGVIVGVATLSGSPRGFMLVPRIPGN